MALSMDTIRVDVCDRPLRIGWAVRSGDIEAYRRAVCLSFALWGGRLDPVLIADREEETKRVVDLFRVDVVLPVGDSDEVKTLPKKFPIPSIYSFTTRSLWRPPLKNGNAHKSSTSTTLSCTSPIDESGRHASGLPLHFTPHCLRHRYASQLLQAGAPPLYVKRQPGHHSIKLTVDTYGRWLPVGDRGLVDRLDEAASGSKVVAAGRGTILQSPDSQAELGPRPLKVSGLW